MMAAATALPVSAALVPVLAQARLGSEVVRRPSHFKSLPLLDKSKIKVAARLVRIKKDADS
jgi:hypothetical protein